MAFDIAPKSLGLCAQIAVLCLTACQFISRAIPSADYILKGIGMWQTLIERPGVVSLGRQISVSLDETSGFVSEVTDSPMAEETEGHSRLGRQVQSGFGVRDRTICGPIGGEVIAQARKCGFRYAAIPEVP